jgi:hypothetical protein
VRPVGHEGHATIRHERHLYCGARGACVLWGLRGARARCACEAPFLLQHAASGSILPHNGSLLCTRAPHNPPPAQSPSHLTKQPMHSHAAPACHACADPVRSTQGLPPPCQVRHPHRRAHLRFRRGVRPPAGERLQVRLHSLQCPLCRHAARVVPAHAACMRCLPASACVHCLPAHAVCMYHRHVLIGMHCLLWAPCPSACLQKFHG